MSKIDIKDTKGKKVSDKELSADIFEIEPNVHAMHQVVRCQNAMLRQGTHAVKNRGEVSGGGRKPWRQKGTGRARQGSIRSPQWVGGGVVFGPTPRNYAFRINKKVVKLAMRSALSAKLADDELVVLDKLSFEKPSTKEAIKILEALELNGKVTIVIGEDDLNTYLSFRNIQGVTVMSAFEANTYDLLDNASLVMTEDALSRLEEVLA
ncbi:MAG: 50S ribosomal protein L4 [Coriobacteriia bacterium]|nr:50S ribosomal protein L4 [Coriobacteriia bacterium]